MNIDHYPQLKQVVDNHIDKIRIPFEGRQYEFCAMREFERQHQFLSTLYGYDNVIFNYAVIRLNEKLDI